MRRVSFILFLLGLQLCAAAIAYAQWTMASGPFFQSPNSKAGGAMLYRDGILWAGALGGIIWRLIHA